VQLQRLRSGVQTACWHWLLLLLLLLPPGLGPPPLLLLLLLQLMGGYCSSCQVLVAIPSSCQCP
jgi:hypothetical protein